MRETLQELHHCTELLQPVNVLQYSCPHKVGCYYVRTPASGEPAAHDVHGDDDGADRVGKVPHLGPCNEKNGLILE